MTWSCSCRAPDGQDVEGERTDGSVMRWPLKVNDATVERCADCGVSRPAVAEAA